MISTNDFIASGDSSISAQCDSVYESCLGTSKLVPSVVDCVSRTEACYTSGKYTDAECDAQNGKMTTLSHFSLYADLYVSYLQNYVLQKRNAPKVNLTSRKTLIFILDGYLHQWFKLHLCPFGVPDTLRTVPRQL